MNWFTDLTGLPSDRPDVVRAGIGVEGEWLVLPNGRRLRAGRLSLPALGEIAVPPRGRPRFREVIADVRDLHADPANAGAVFLVASQFNLLEMLGPGAVPEDGIACYAQDRTQGPACAMSCAAGTIFRNYLVPIGDRYGQSGNNQIDTMADVERVLGGGLWEMRNGYLLPRSGALERITQLIEGQERYLRDLVRVGMHADTEVTLPGGGHVVTQVYASALPVAYGDDPADDWEPFARLVLEAAYEAVFRLAVPGRTLFLTRLGGGAFGNRPEWINDAILKAARRSPTNLDLAMVSYRGPDPANRPLAAAFLA